MTSKASTKNQLRIIGGQWRGRKLAIADIDGLRPTGDRIRETLFNWLMPVIKESVCLDLFAGSGALGLEALSRGAKSVLLLEKHPRAADTLRQHCQTLGTDQAQLITTDSLLWLKEKPARGDKIDIAFIDPPFAANLWDSAIAALEQSGLLAEDAWIYIEAPKTTPITCPANWQLHREKHAGQITYRLYQRRRCELS